MASIPAHYSSSYHPRSRSTKAGSVHLPGVPTSPTVGDDWTFPAQSCPHAQTPGTFSSGVSFPSLQPLGNSDFTCDTQPSSHFPQVTLTDPSFVKGSLLYFLSHQRLLSPSTHLEKSQLPLYVFIPGQFERCEGREWASACHSAR